MQCPYCFVCAAVPQGVIRARLFKVPFLCERSWSIFSRVLSKEISLVDRPCTRSLIHVAIGMFSPLFSRFSEYTFRPKNGMLELVSGILPSDKFQILEMLCVLPYFSVSPGTPNKGNPGKWFWVVTVLSVEKYKAILQWSTALRKRKCWFCSFPPTYIMCPLSFLSPP